MHICTLITMVASFLADKNSVGCFNSSKFDLKVHPMALEMSDKAMTQAYSFMRHSLILNQMVTIYAIYSRVLYEIPPCSGIRM